MLPMQVQKEHYLNYRKIFLHDTKNIFETEKKSTHHARPDTATHLGPTPFGGLSNAAAVAMASALTRSQQPTAGKYRFDFNILVKKSNRKLYFQFRVPLSSVVWYCTFLWPDSKLNNSFLRVPGPNATRLEKYSSLRTFVTSMLIPLKFSDRIKLFKFCSAEGQVDFHEKQCDANNFNIQLVYLKIIVTRNQIS